jgi:hypothetical protein
MTGQQVFNKVAKHLMKQNAQAIVGATCKYRGDEGMTCAIGCLIPNAKYRPEFEGEAVWSATWGLEIIKAAGLRKNQRGLAEELQKVHDSFPPTEWKAALRAVAKEFKFTLPKEIR